MNGKDEGFTLVELLVVLVVVALLASIASPMVAESIVRAKESALKENLFVVRKTLDQFYGDNGHYPESLNELVNDGYLRNVPKDPFTSSDDTWEFKLDDSGRISDIFSGHDEVSKDGSRYREW